MKRPLSVFQTPHGKLAIRPRYLKLKEILIEESDKLLEELGTVVIREFRIGLKKHVVAIKKAKEDRSWREGRLVSRVSDSRFHPEQQFRALYHLKKRGINVIEPIGYFYSEDPKKRRLFTVYLDCIVLSSLSPEELRNQREKLLNNLAIAYAKLFEKRVFIGDPKLSNFALKDGEIYFIDVEVVELAPAVFEKDNLVRCIAGFIYENGSAGGLLSETGTKELFIHKLFTHCRQSTLSILGSEEEFTNLVNLFLSQMYERYIKYKSERGD